MSTSTNTARKRKSDASTSASAKKVCVSSVDVVAEKVRAILADPDNYPVPEDTDATRQSLIELALYARSLEQAIDASRPKAKTAEELEAAAEKLRTAARNGICKQMSWKPSCKTDSAKWTYDGVCADAAVFGALLKLDGPPKFKAKKMPTADFNDIIGRLQASVRYDTLSVTGTDVNIRWNPEEGTFKFSGTYGRGI